MIETLVEIRRPQQHTTEVKITITCSSQGNTTIDHIGPKGTFSIICLSSRGAAGEGADHKFSNKIISSVGRIQEIACEARIKCTVLDLSKNQCRVGIIPIRFWLIAFRFSSIAPGGCFIGHDKDSH